MDQIHLLIKYLYLIIFIVLIIAFVYVLKGLSKIKKTMSPINDDINLINEHLAKIKEKEEIINHTKDVSLSFFLKTYAILSISKIVLKDFFKSNPKKRNIKKSVKRIYKLSKSI